MGTLKRKQFVWVIHCKKVVLDSVNVPEPLSQLKWAWPKALTLAKNRGSLLALQPLEVVNFVVTEDIKNVCIFKLEKSSSWLRTEGSLTVSHCEGVGGISPHVLLGLIGLVRFREGLEIGREFLDHNVRNSQLSCWLLSLDILDLL